MVLPYGSFSYKYNRKIAITVIALMLFSLLATWLPQRVLAAGTTYYVDSIGGADSNSGTSTGSPWQTLAKVNGTTFAAGDRILFKSGGIWTGQLWPKGSGTSGSPIVIDQYGTGNKPIINGNGTSYPTNTSGAVMLYNQEYWEINNLEVTNYSTTVTSSRAGILVYNNDPGVKNHIYVKNTYVHDVNSSESGNKITGGIIFFGTHIDKDGVATIGRQSGFNDVLVENNTVKSVTKEGIRNKSDAGNGYPRINTNIVFRGNFVEDIWGDGMVLGEVLSGAVAEYNIVKNHSKTTSGSYAGLWTHYTTQALVQFNEVYDGTNGGNDGEAFDSDNSCDGDIFQYNYSHNNRGGLILVMPTATNLKFRYNISENDGGGLYNQIFHYPNGNANNYFYNNTIYLGAGTTNYIFRPLSATTIQPKFYNNIIKADGTVTAFGHPNVTWGAGAEFKNNLFYPATIDDVNGPPSHTGLITADPLLTNPGAGVSNIDMTDPNKLPGYKLQPGSPAINSGISISGNGGKDFYGNPVYSGAADIGANEVQGFSNGNTFYATADAYVRDGSSANTNFGTAATLAIKSDVAGYARKAYTKFNYSSFSGPSASSAKVRLNVSAVNTDATRTIKVYGTTDESWTETGITWNNAPAGTTYLGSVTVSNAAGLWYELDVTSYVNSQMSDKQVSFLLVNEGTGSAKGDVDFTSREASTNKPELVLTAPAPFYPTADAYVRDGSYANTNFGTAATLAVKSDATGYARKSYAKFNYATFSGSSASSAKLRLYASTVNTDATRTIKVYGTTDESWTETGITWNNAPTGTTYLGSLTVSNFAGLWYELDVTSYINSQMSDKQVSFLLVNEGTASSKSDVDFASREALLNNPELVMN